MLAATHQPVFMADACVEQGAMHELCPVMQEEHVLVAGLDPSELVSLEEVERRYILRVIEAVGGNRTRAAEVLGVDRKTLYTKLKSYGWRPSDPPP